MFSSSPTLTIHLDNPRESYIPYDILTGHVLLKTSTSPLDVSSLGITFRATECVRYNSNRDETLLFNYPQTLFQGPYTLRENQEYVYPFEFEFPETTDPPGPEEKILRHFETNIKHRLPPSTEHNRPGVRYSFDAEIKYELYAWVMKRKRLGSGEKVSEASLEKLKFLPSDPDREELYGKYLNYRCVEMVGVEEAAEEVEKQHGRFSKLFSSKPKQDASPSSAGGPGERIEINIQAPCLLTRNAPNPFHFSVKEAPGQVKLRSLTVELKSLVHVPCMEITVYGVNPGVGEEVQIINVLSEEDYNSSRTIALSEWPWGGEEPPLSLPLFPTPHHQLPMYTFDFRTFKIERTHLLSFEAKFSCSFGGREHEFKYKQRNLPLMVPFPASRAPEVEKEKGGETSPGPSRERKGKEAEASVDLDEPPPAYKN